MAVRDISGTAYAAPGTARLTFGLVMSNQGDNSLPLDVILNIYAPNVSNAGFSISAGVTAIPIPNPTNQRGVLVFPPINNSDPFNVKTQTGDDGDDINPNGWWGMSFDPDNMPSNVYITTTVDMDGCAIYWF